MAAVYSMAQIAKSSRYMFIQRKHVIILIVLLIVLIVCRLEQRWQYRNTLHCNRTARAYYRLNARSGYYGYYKSEKYAHEYRYLYVPVEKV